MGHASTVDGLQAEWAPIAARLDALDKALWQRATDTARGAGLCQMRNVWHNAMVGRDYGHPWREVDYSCLRLAIRIDEVLRARVYDLRRRLWDRVYRRHFPEYQGR